jgi:alpha-glucoside transport system substrate-binding protein
VNLQGGTSVGPKVPGGEGTVLPHNEGVISLQGKGAFVLFVLLAVTGVAACGPEPTDGMPNLSGVTLDVLADWQGPEEVRFRRVLDAFERETGAAVRYTSAGGRSIGLVVDELIAAGRAPDVAVLPQPGLIARYARAGRLERLDAPTQAVVARGYGRVWRDHATVDGQQYGVWFKAAHKSLVWYRIGLFERAGIVPPADLDGLLDRARALAGGGVAPFSVAGADGWTLTDWFENVYLHGAGLQRYDDLAAHRLPWTDPSVVTALRTLARIFVPPYLAGGTTGALRTSFEAAVAAVFNPVPQAAMILEGDFVPAVAGDAVSSEIGVDVDVFPFPAGALDRGAMVGAGDAAVVMRAGPPAAGAISRRARGRGPGRGGRGFRLPQPGGRPGGLPRRRIPRHRPASARGR